MEVTNKGHVVFDPIYGFIKLTSTEWAIVHSPFYQRLRWIKQLGFALYIFHGAEHSRFGHSIGAMFNAHKILESIGLACSEEELMDSQIKNEKVMYHRSLRLAALMHDLGTFCFSHTTESAYISFNETSNLKNGKNLKDDHENLGSFIIKNTDYAGGITKILNENGFDPKVISDLVKGVHPSYLANQILHSEIDCDRMDYLLRDAHYTGLKYGSYDRDYLLYHFKMAYVDGHRILTIKHNALHCVEDFLTARFAWYSQVVRSPRGARYDAIAEKICLYFLKKGYIYKYSELLDMISREPMKFYNFNDNYFISLVHQKLLDGSLDKDKDIKDMATTLLLQRGAKVIRSESLVQRLLNPDDIVSNEKIIKRAESKISEIKDFLKKKGDKSDWVISDLPKKDITFAKSANKIMKDTTNVNVLLERDPVKIYYESGEVKLLAQVENSIISKLQTLKNFLPNVFCSDKTYQKLLNAGIVEKSS